MSTNLFWVDIEDGGGNKLGTGPLRPREFRQNKRLSESGEFSFAVSSASPNTAALSEKRTAICRYIDSGGQVQVFGGGVIDTIERQFDQDGQLIYAVSGNDLTRELTYRSVKDLALAGVDGAGVTDGPDQIMALAPPGWTVSGGATATPVYAAFDGESVLAALVRVGEHIAEHWRLGSGRQVSWLGPASAFLDSGVRAVQSLPDPTAAEDRADLAVISSLQEVSDAADLVTRIYPRGSGNGAVAATLSAATDAPPAGYTLDTANNFLRADASETSYGQIERFLDYKEIGPISNTTPDIQSASNMLLQAALAHLQRYSQPAQFYKIEMASCPILEPGTLLRVTYRKLVDGAVIYDLEGVFCLLSVEQGLDENGRFTASVDVATVDRQPSSDAEFLAGQSQSARVLAAHPQLSASVDNIGWRDEMDADHDAGFRFWLGNEYTSLQQALFRFQVQPLRSTVKSVGGSSATTGTSSKTSADGGGHGHMINIHDGTYDTPLGVRTSAGLAGAYAPTGVGNTNLEVGVQDNHTHDISHTHTVTPAVTMVYGIYEELGANTLSLADLAISLNGGADLAGQVEDIGGGWYALDLTDGLVDEVFRPSQENNELVFSTGASKTARIEAQLTVRGVVQAVAYQ